MDSVSSSGSVCLDIDDSDQERLDNYASDDSDSLPTFPLTGQVILNGLDRDRVNGQRKAGLVSDYDYDDEANPADVTGDVDPPLPAEHAPEGDLNECSVDSHTDAPNIEAEQFSDIEMPPEVADRCSSRLEHQIAELYQKMVDRGSDMNEAIQRSKDFRNPSIYEKLLSHLGIDEYGTNFPPSIYNPRSFGKDSYYEELSRAQKVAMDKWMHEQSQPQRKSNHADEQSCDSKKNKKSRFDHRTADGGE